jgi:hypothetical protein
VRGVRRDRNEHTKVDVVALEDAPTSDDAVAFGMRGQGIGHGLGHQVRHRQVLAGALGFLRQELHGVGHFEADGSVDRRIFGRRPSYRGHASSAREVLHVMSGDVSGHT